MRVTILILVALLALSFATLAAPEAGAVGYCTSVTGNCDGYILCFGEQTSYGHITHCQVGIREPPCTCDPMPEPW